MNKFKIGDIVALRNPMNSYNKRMGTVVGVVGPSGDRYRIGGVRGLAAPIIVLEEDLVRIAQTIPLQEHMSYVDTDAEYIRNMYSALRKCKGRDRIFVPKIKNVILNDPAVIVLWEDDTKTVVKAQGEKFDPEKGLAMAISKKALGNKHSYYGVFLKNIPGLKKKGAK